MYNLVLIVLALLARNAAALYEDQIHKFDWRRLQIGALSEAHVELNTFQPRLLVTTKEDVLATLCPKSGELVWRQVFETASRGKIKLLQVNTGDSSGTAAAHPNSKHGFDAFTVHGHAPAIVRGWNTNIGTIEWEWSLMPLQAEQAEYAFWLHANNILYYVLPIWQSHLEITQYLPTSGQVIGLTGKVTTPWISEEKCIKSGIYYVCLEDNVVISIELTATQPQVLRKVWPTTPKSTIKAIENLEGVVIVDNVLVSLKDDVKVCANLKSKSFKVGKYNRRTIIAQVDVVDTMLEIIAHYAESCTLVNELSYKLPYPEHHGTPNLKSFDCKEKRNNDGKGCLFIFGTEDEAILAVQQGKFRWTREEALTNVVATEFIDLPLADSEGTLENELKGNTDDIVTAFLRRLTTQIIHMKSIFLHVIGLGAPPTDTQKAGLVRDSFGLHKMLVLLTSSGKIFGIDNINGKHHWQLFLPNVNNFANKEKMRLVIQRSTKHFPLEPLCTIVAQDKFTGNGVLFRFNPITGKSAEGGLLKLGFKIKQMSLLPESEVYLLKGILVIDVADKLYVYPDNVKNMATGMYLFAVNIASATLDGFHVKESNNELTATHIWNSHLEGHNTEQQIIAVAGKNPIERVHSQGRVLGDRSVLYKYINPNLVAVVTQGTDSIHKYTLSVYLVDVVSGSIVFSMIHRKARGPVHIVHSENWLAYTYYNDKVRRTEITTIELYEGKTQANSTTWSSLHAPPMPLIERQSYILPAIVEGMRETITERGITNKDILIATASGAIVELPWALLDPRRPVSPEGREEGSIPYIPELPLPSENIINYNQTLARINNIYTAPSGLESTCLVVVTGLDLFVTRVAPSKSFDLLKEDFDYILITVVLVALTSGSLIAKQLASRKLIKQAWK